jgi:hypothetical protein
LRFRVIGELQPQLPVNLGLVCRVRGPDHRSQDDPRVQVADLIAGVAQRLPGTVDDGPLQPFLSPTSLRDPER